MVNNNNIRLIESEYNKTLYTGMQAFIMSQAHSKLEKLTNINTEIDKVLKIGVGSHSYINYINHEYEKYHILELNNFCWVG